MRRWPAILCWQPFIWILFREVQGHLVLSIHQGSRVPAGRMAVGQPGRPPRYWLHIHFLSNTQCRYLREVVELDRSRLASDMFLTFSFFSRLFCQLQVGLRRGGFPPFGCDGRPGRAGCQFGLSPGRGQGNFCNPSRHSKRSGPTGRDWTGWVTRPPGEIVLAMKAARRPEPGRPSFQNLADVACLARQSSRACRGIWA